MGVSKNNNTYVCKKGWKIYGRDDQKHISLNFNGIIYNLFESIYVCRNLDWAPTTKNKQETKEENSAVADSGFTRNFMEVSAHLNNVQPATKIINAKFPNGYIIRSTIEGGLDLPVLPNIARQEHILPNIKQSLVFIGALCDAICTVTFKIKYGTVIYKDDIILWGCRIHHNTLWYFPP